MLQLKLCGVAAIVASSPYWLYQIWAFIVPGPAPQRAQVVAGLRRRRRAAVLRRRRDRLLRAAQGPRGPHRLHPGGAAEPRRVRRVLHLPHPDAAGLRHRLRDPAVRDHAQPRRRGLRQAAGPLPALDHPRHLRLRRGRDPVHRPVLDADAGRPDAGAVPRRRGRSPGSSTGPAAAARTAPTSGPTTSCRRCDGPEPGALPDARPVRPARLARRRPRSPGTPETGIRTGHRVRGRLHRATRPADELPCDLLAVDQAYPAPVADDDARLRAHQAWRHGQSCSSTHDGPAHPGRARHRRSPPTGCSTRSAGWPRRSAPRRTTTPPGCGSAATAAPLR